MKKYTHVSLISVNSVYIACITRDNNSPKGIWPSNTTGSSARRSMLGSTLPLGCTPLIVGTSTNMPLLVEGSESIKRPRVASGFNGYSFDSSKHWQQQQGKRGRKWPCGARHNKNESDQTNQLILFFLSSCMDYLRTLGSAAVSTLVQKSGLNLPFTLGPKVASLDGICSLYEGTKKVCYISPYLCLIFLTNFRMTPVQSLCLNTILVNAEILLP